MDLQYLLAIWFTVVVLVFCRIGMYFVLIFKEDSNGFLKESTLQSYGQVLSSAGIKIQGVGGNPDQSIHQETWKILLHFKTKITN